MDIAGAIETWRRVLTQPGEPVFEQEKLNPNGTLQTALIWMVIAGVVAAVFGLIRGFIGATTVAALTSQLGLPPGTDAQLQVLLNAVRSASGWAIFTVPLGFLIGTFILHLVAKLLGGQGEYSTFAYLTATFQAPLTMGSAILGIIPGLGDCISTLVMIYAYVLSFFAVKVNYGLTSGRALTVVLIPLAIAVLLGICIAVLIAFVFVSVSNN